MITPKYKIRNFASAAVSKVSSELFKKHNLTYFSRANQKLFTDTMRKDCGTIIISEEHKELSKYTLQSDDEVLDRYKTVGLSREEFQVYLAIFDLFVSNSKKNDCERPILISLRDFHLDIMGIKNRLKQANIERYKNIFQKLSSIFIEIDTSTAVISPFTKKNNRKIIINSSITNIAIITLKEFKCDLIKIFPTEFMLFEYQKIKQISNYLPRDFLKLDTREQDNILYFGYYLVQLHNINKNKRIKLWETSLQKTISTALPDPEDFFNKYSDNRKKTELVNCQIYKPLIKSLNIMKNNNYIKNYYLDTFDKKNSFDEKLKIEFNYIKNTYSRINKK